MSLKLVIGNKAYSSWSFRPWIAMTHIGIPFEEILIPLYQPDTKARYLQYTPTGKVPVLIDGDLAIWETLAILDYLDEFHARGRLWPKARAARAMARSIASEMHAGFGALRELYPMNMTRAPKAYPPTPEVREQADRIEAMWGEARRTFGSDGQFLFGTFSAADAMYAPVVNRLHVYDVPVKPETRAYMDAMMNLPAWKAWQQAGIAEPWRYDIYNR